MPKPLDGFKVIEIGQEIQGPFAALFLADLGASVVKIEPRASGDPSRWLLPKLIDGDAARNGEVSPYFIAMNRGKRSLTLDLKKPGAVEIVRRLARSHDVLVTNYRPGVLDRLGLGYEELRRVNPRLVFGQASSWGGLGPWMTRPSRDILAQAASGLVAKGGMPEDPPLPAPALVGDHAGGLTLAAGILAALTARERTGEGGFVDASIYGTLIAMQSLEIDYVSLSGLETRRAGRSHQLMNGVYSSYRTRDGTLCLASVDDRRWPAFCRIMGIEHLEHAPEGANVARNFHGDRLQAVLDEIFPRKTSREWLDAFEQADILAAEVVDYRRVLESEQARRNGYVRRMDHPVAGSVLVTGSPVVMDGAPDVAAEPPPELGQHTEEVLLELGYTWEQIATFRDAGVI